MVKEPVTLSDWIQFLTSLNNRIHSYSIAIFSVGVVFVTSSIIILSLYLNIASLSVALETDLSSMINKIDALFRIIVFGGLFLVLFPFFLRFYFRKSDNVLLYIMKQKEVDVDEIREIWFNRGKIMLKGRYLEFLFYIGAICVIVFGCIGIFWLNDLAIGYAILSIGIALFSMGIAISSDLKMKALTELNFVEKNAMINGYIARVTEKPEEDIKRIIKDLEASFKVSQWIKYCSLKTKIDYINSLLKLLNIISSDKIMKTLDESDKIDIYNLIEEAKIFNHKIEELDELKRRFKLEK